VPQSEEDSSMKKLLFIVNGLGMGNSTRCESIIERLIDKKIDIEILTSGNGLLYFKERDYVSKLHEFRSLYYGSKNGQLSIWLTMFAIPNFISIFFYNVKFLRNLLRATDYSGIVIDSDYTLAWLRPWVRVPVFALNNADVVVKECRKLTEIPREIRMQHLIEKSDAWYHRAIPDTVLSPTIESRKSANPKTLKHFPPFVRQGLNVRTAKAELRTILVMLSGSQFSASTEFLQTLTRRGALQIHVIGGEGESNDWITFHGKVYQNRDMVNQADLMVINGGFSAVSEAVVLRKPVVVIPVPHHAEQFINALTVERAGLGLTANRENILEKINEVIDRFPEFVEAHRSFGCPTNGANQAAEHIYAEISSQVVSVN
jgi:uncharacterized protein (TIGR00661 family)